MISMFKTCKFQSSDNRYSKFKELVLKVSAFSKDRAFSYITYLCLNTQAYVRIHAAHPQPLVGYSGIYNIPSIRTKRRPSSDLNLSLQGLQLSGRTKFSTWLLAA